MSESARTNPPIFPRLERLPFATGVFIAALAWTVTALSSVILYTGLDWPKIAIGALAVFAASAVSGLIGFMFGVPKGPSGDVEGQRANYVYFRPNTNLEQVSDWLTKIIVGVGLIEFRQIGGLVVDLGRTVGTVIGDLQGKPGSGTVFAIGLMAATAAINFLVAYMWTTTTLYSVYTTHIARTIPRSAPD